MLTNQQLFIKSEVVDYYLDTAWQKIIFREMEAMLLSESRPFPCLFGVSGFKSNQLRFAFFDELSPNALSSALNCIFNSERTVASI